jgi:DNA-binding SARP family transcriptional activator
MTATLALLGSPQLLRADGTRHDLPNNVPGFLAAWLALRGDWAEREALCLVFWPERSASAALHNLRANLHRLRAWLEPHGLADALATEKRRVRLALRSDAALLRAACGAGQWSEALALHRGTFMDGSSLPGMPGVDEWLHAQRRALDALWREAALRQARQWQHEGRAADAAALLQQQLAQQTLAEDLLQALLAVAPQAGCVSAALDLSERFTQRLRSELELEPMPATVAALRTLREGPAALAPTPAPPAATSTAGPAAAAPNRPLAARLLAPPLVGRSIELEQLRAWRGQSAGRLLLVRGEPGAGKTRLVESAWPDALWLNCARGAGDAAPALQPVADWLADQLDALREQPVFQQHRRLFARLVPQALSGEALAPGGDSAQALIAATVALLQAQGRPIAIDDLQWADAATLQLLSALIRHAQLPLAATLRSTDTACAALPPPEPARAWIQAQASAQAAVMLELTPLPEAAMAQLVAALSDQAGGAPRFAQWLHQRSAGNPFFALETLRALFAEGRLHADAQGWHSAIDDVAADYRDLALPPRVAEIVRLRVQGLSEATQRVLRVCAVAGHARWLDALAETAGLSALALADALGQAQAAGVLKGREFAHALAREALLEAMPEVQRAGTHAAWLRHAAACLSPHERAVHAFGAGDAVQTTRATVQAAKLDCSRGQQASAEALLRAALDRCAEPALRAALLAALGDVARQLGRLDDAERHAQAALAELPEPAERARAWVLRGEVALQQGRVREVPAFADAALEAEPALPEAWMLKVKWAHAMGDFAAGEATLRERLAQLRRQRPDAEWVTVLTSLGTMLDFQGRHDLAWPLHQEALHVARRLGARYSEVEVALNAIWCLPELGRHDEAIALGEHALALGEFDATPTLLNNLAWIHLDRGRLDDAARLYQRLTNSADPTMVCVAQAKLLQIHAQRGRAAELQQQAQTLLACLAQTDHPQGRAIAVLALLEHGPAALRAQAARLAPAQPVDSSLQARLDEALARQGLVERGTL